MQEIIPTLAIWALPVLLAITLHEAAHGYVARHFGDNTAFLAGRISLNPLRHVDPVGTLALPLGMYLISAAAGVSPILFGWAKPVPVDPSRLRKPKTDMFWVAGAGPFANLVMAGAWATLFKLADVTPHHAYTGAMMAMADAGMMINAILLILNLLPIPPLDGGRILLSVMPSGAAARFARIEPFGFPLLIALLYAFGDVIWRAIALFRVFLATVFGF